jgi:S1-C subfamily serine protease
MSNSPNLLGELSRATANRAAAAQAMLAAIRTADGRHLTGTLWRGDLLVASEQALPKADEYQVVVPDGSTVTAQPAGRDNGTNVALLRLPQVVEATSPVIGQASPGALALAFGADGSGRATVRMGVVNLVGPEWHSSRGGRIDQRIELDMRLARAEEGGPVFDVAGGFLGISTLGPHGQVLVIPAATVDRVIPPLLTDGRVSRGWLGVALQPVAVPDALHEVAGQSRAFMVMSIVDGGPAAKAGIVAGDIVLSVDGISARSYRNIAILFGPDSIGRTLDVRLIRGGAVLSLQTAISPRPAE